MHDFYDQLIPTLSANRLTAYFDNDPRRTTLEVVARYIHNIDVSQSLTPSLHILEVALRNGIHRACTDHFKTEQWFDTSDILAPPQLRQLQAAKAKLSRTAKRDKTAHRVPELSLGFWTGLFSAHYEHRLWRRHPQLLVAIFPYAPRHCRTRAVIGNMLDPIRKLRNPVAHHERIAARADLADMKRDINRLVSWLSPAATRLLAQCDAFSAIASPSGIADSRRRARVCFGSSNRPSN